MNIPDQVLDHRIQKAVAADVQQWLCEGTVGQTEVPIGNIRKLIIELLSGEPDSRVKIVQLILTDAKYHGFLLGLGSDGVVYKCHEGRWVKFIPPVGHTGAL